MSHTFHIPVLGLGYSVDTPLKVAKYGISSVASIVDDELIERIRKLHSGDFGYLPILRSEPNFRSRRITAYLNFMKESIDQQFNKLKSEAFLPGTDITRYFELLPPHSASRKLYEQMLREVNPQKKSHLQNRLRTLIVKGSIDVNIMSKVDKMNQNIIAGEEPLSDALAALKGFAESDLSSSLILSAGMNPRLYSYIEEFADFYPLNDQPPKKKIILKVSDFRSAFIQAKFLAKKGLWVHEFRIESGLNCGGHAFATEGFLLGPILEEFKQSKSEMSRTLFDGYCQALLTKGIVNVKEPQIRITVQGGIGTAEENEFLLQHYRLDGTGWGSPFLLVPEATNVDDETLQNLANSVEDDFYISGSSPLGIPFNNFRKSSAETQRLERISKGRPGSPCTKKYLVSNTEFTDEPICTSSREYQNLKIKQLLMNDLAPEDFQEKFNQITEKVCLCEGLCASAYIKNNILKPRENKAVTICPGPNTAYFSRTYSLDEMVKHIYGKLNLLEGVNRPNMFINEIKLYIDYLRKDVEGSHQLLNEKKAKQLEKFKDQLINGIHYYMDLIPEISKFGQSFSRSIEDDLKRMKQLINQVTTGVIPVA